MKHLTQNKTVIDWIEEKIALVSPDEVMWIDGSEEQLDALRAKACETGEMTKLNEDLLPGCLLTEQAQRCCCVLRTAHSSAAESCRIRQIRPTTGWIPLRLIRCS